MRSSTRLFMIAITAAAMSMEPPATTKDVFQVRADLYASSRLPAKVYELQRTRALVTDVIAQQCWLMVLAIIKTHDLLGNALPRIGILGGGHMGCAITMALLKNKYPPDRIVISTRQPDRVPKCEALANPNHASLFQAVPRCYDNTRLSKESEILILCMPPSQLKSVAIQIKHALGIAQSSCVVISVLCGVAIETIQKACGTKLVTRTQIHVQEFNSLVTATDQDDDEDNPESTRDGSASSDVLARLQQDAQSIAAQHLVRTEPLMASPLAHALHELACRLSRPGASQAPETVATVLCGGGQVSTQEDPIDKTHTDESPPEMRPAQAEAPGVDADVEADATDPQPAVPPPLPSWLPEWTVALEQLQRHSGLL